MDVQYTPVSGIAYSYDTSATSLCSAYAHSPRSAYASTSCLSSGSSHNLPSIVASSSTLGAPHAAHANGTHGTTHAVHAAAAGVHAAAVGVHGASASAGNTSFPMRLAIDASGAYMAVSLSNKDIQLFDFVSAQYITTLIGHSEVVLALCFSNDGRHLMSFSADRCATHIFGTLYMHTNCELKINRLKYNRYTCHIFTCNFKVCKCM